MLNCQDSISSSTRASLPNSSEAWCCTARCASRVAWPHCSQIAARGAFRTAQVSTARASSTASAGERFLDRAELSARQDRLGTASSEGAAPSTLTSLPRNLKDEHCEAWAADDLPRLGPETSPAPSLRQSEISRDSRARPCLKRSISFQGSCGFGANVNFTIINRVPIAKFRRASPGHQYYKQY